MSRYTHHREAVPLSILDGSDGELVVEFDWAPGTAPSGLSGPPEHYDPGDGDEIVITGCSYDTTPGIPVGLGPHEEERVVEWLDENWIRPEDDGPDPDYLRDTQRDDRLLDQAERDGL